MVQKLSFVKSHASADIGLTTTKHDEIQNGDKKMYIDESHRPLSRADYEAIGRRARSETFHAGLAQIARIFGKK